MNKKRGRKKSSWKKELLQIIGIVTFIIVARFFLFSPIQVKSVSMNPTLFENDRSWSIKVGKVARFDIISFHAPDHTNKPNVAKGPDQDYIKRVIGLPGDTIEYKEGSLYINNRKLKEPFIKYNKAEYNTTHPYTENFVVQKVPEDHYFVLGDNRVASYDSRDFGLIAKEDVIGKVKVRYWPLNRIGLVN